VTGPVISTAYVTGFDYSDVGPILEEAGKLTGVSIAKHPENSDLFFTASDNLPLARLGIPAHTLSVGFIFPDYHKVGDEWQKLDYDNMAKVVRAVALGVCMIANGDDRPRWNPNNSRASPYRKVREAAPAAK
jgi:Zn-dependent M28 family amino/carboxypeptidase